MENKIKSLIKEMNLCWLNSEYDSLKKYYHPETVLFRGADNEAIIGCDAIIKSYREFGSMGKIHLFDITSIDIYHFGELFIAHMGFEVDYEIPSGRFKEEGIEVYALIPVKDTYQIVWRNQVSKIPSK
jgi:hypothetical protein